MKLSLKRSLALSFVFAIAPLCAVPNEIAPTPQPPQQTGFMKSVVNHICRHKNITAIGSALSIGAALYFLIPKISPKNAARQATIREFKKYGIYLDFWPTAMQDAATAALKEAPLKPEIF